MLGVPWCSVLSTVLMLRPAAGQNVELADMRTLSELPLEKLLQVRNTFAFDEEDLYYSAPRSISNITGTAEGRTPEAQALIFSKGKDQPLKRDDYDDYDYKKSSKKALSTLFQTTVTTLAFLAFGGFLLCLLVQAIRARQAALAAMTTTTVAAVRRRKKKPNKHKPWVGRPHPRTRREAAPWPALDPDDLYHALTRLAEGYVLYSDGHAGVEQFTFGF